MSNFKSPPPGSVPGNFSPDLDQLDQGFGQQMGQNNQQNPFAGGSGMPGSSTPPKPPRPVGSFPQEMKYFAQDIGQGVVSVMPDILQEVLGIKSTDTPEQVAKKKQMHQRYQEMNAAEQAYVQKKAQEEMAKKQQEEQERIIRQQEEEQIAAESDVSIPQGKTTGEEGSSTKKRTLNKLQNDRKKLSSAG
jgi:hypothetical protein